MHDVVLMKGVVSDKGDKEFCLTGKIQDFCLTFNGPYFVFYRQIKWMDVLNKNMNHNMDILIFHDNKFFAIPTKNYNKVSSVRGGRLGLHIFSDVFIAENSDELLSKNVVGKLHNESALHLINADDLFQLLDCFYCKT